MTYSVRQDLRMILVARSTFDFGAGPLAIEAGEADLTQLQDGHRLIVEFADCEMLFTAIGRARGAVHLGCYVAPWSYVHWKLETKTGSWSLSTADGAELARLKRFLGG